MLTFARQGDTIVVESISRFARNTRDLLELMEQLNAKGIGFVDRGRSCHQNAKYKNYNVLQPILGKYCKSHINVGRSSRAESMFISGGYWDPVVPNREERQPV